jgi:putative iron-regulated protein
MTSNRTTLSFAFAALLTPLTAALAQAEPRATVAEAYAAFAHKIYRGCRERAERLRTSVDALVAAPSEQALAAARVSWIEARKVYGQTEVLRFYGGPIDNAKDGPETLLNAWPVDEAYIDLVADGDPAGGILQDAARYPNLSATVLTLANERGGEANICVGWHAVEFMLWGQDFFDDGPGRRSYTAFVDGMDAHAARRREYLSVLVRLLVQQLRALEQAWRPAADNYRARFLAEPKVAVRRILTGMVVLSGFELGGERTAVAYETQDQEDEHSCFSDTTHLDFMANQLGILHVWRGTGPGMNGHGLRALAEATDSELAASIEGQLAATAAMFASMPKPFDQTIRGGDDSDGRKALDAVIDALAQQTDLLAALGLALGYEVPVKPVDR